MLNILVIDDTRSVHAFVKSLIQRSNLISMTSVYNGQEALTLLQNGNKFDLIFLDASFRWPQYIC